MDNKNRPQTGRKALQWAASFLIEQGFAPEQVQNEGRQLLAKAWHKEKLELLLALNEELPEEVWCKFQEDVERRGNYEPLQYLVGSQEFMDLSFKVTPDVLIPRWDTEILVEEALKVGRKLDEPRILDLCTGSGAAALSLAYYLPESKVHAVDISAPALAVAQENAANLGVGNKVKFYQGDLFAPLSPPAKFHLIVSNPPYISREEYQELPLDVKKEPVLALLGGEDGLDFYRRIAQEAENYLLPGGFLLLEIGYRQAPDVKEILQQNNFHRLEVVQDWGGRDRVVRGELCYTNNNLRKG